MNDAHQEVFQVRRELRLESRGASISVFSPRRRSWCWGGWRPCLSEVAGLGVDSETGFVLPPPTTGLETQAFRRVAHSVPIFIKPI